MLDKILDIFFAAPVEWALFIGVIVYLVIYSMRRRKLEQAEDEIIKTRIVDVQSRSRSTTRTSTSSAMKRAAVGGVLFGRKGAEYGANTAKKHTVTTEDDIVVFKVWWEDGDKTIEKVRRGSDEYELYLEYLDD